MSDALAAGTRLGPYEIDTLIGAGGSRDAVERARGVSRRKALAYGGSAAPDGQTVLCGALWDAGIMNYQSLQVTPDGQSQVYSWHRALSNLFIAEGLV